MTDPRASDRMPPLGFLMVTSGYPPARTAGLEQGCLRLSRGLARRGHRVTVLTLATAGLPTDETDTEGVRVLRVLSPWPFGPVWGLSYAWQVRSWMRRLASDWDLALCHQLYLHSGVAGRVGAALGKPTASLLVAAQPRSDTRPAYSDIARLAEMRAGQRLLAFSLANDAYFVLSELARRELGAAGISPGRILDYRYFVDIEAFREAPLPPGPCTFAFVGRFHFQKNLPLLLDAFDDVAARRADVRLRLVGEGPDESMIRSRAAASPAASRIEFRPWTTDPVAQYHDATVVVTASMAEGLSNVLLEAMACGRPVVTTDVSGAREALDLRPDLPDVLPAGRVERGRGGFVVGLGDRQALAAALDEVASAPGLAADLACAARARVVEAFSERPVVDAFLRHAAALVADADRSRRARA